MLEHDGRQPVALWVVNDTPRGYPGARVRWRVEGQTGACCSRAKCRLRCRGERIAAGDAARLVDPARRLRAYHAAAVRCRRANCSARTPTTTRSIPGGDRAGYPWKFDPYLGTKVFDRPGAPSLADQGISPVLRLVPLALRERSTEWVLRQRLPTPVVSRIARVVDAPPDGNNRTDPRGVQLISPSASTSSPLALRVERS